MSLEIEDKWKYGIIVALFYGLCVTVFVVPFTLITGIAIVGPPVFEALGIGMILMAVIWWFFILTGAVVQKKSGA